jgi:FKBP-type peptidyl-prolyl cis-trans isomerase (trigger factor)
VEGIKRNFHLQLSSLIIDYEVQRRQTQLLDDVRKVGLTIDAYLQSKNTSQEHLVEHFKDDVIATYKLEYALSEIAEKENITVEPAEIDALFGNIKGEAEKAEAELKAQAEAEHAKLEAEKAAEQAELEAKQKAVEEAHKATEA